MAVRPSRGEYRRNLPHIEVGGRPMHITFCTKGEFVLPESMRGIVLEHCLAEDGRKCVLHCVVVMFDHVHMLMSLMANRETKAGYSLAAVMSGIKGASSHSVNKALGRSGHVWQDEVFDRILRGTERLEEKMKYLRENPVRKGLVKVAEEWPWYWDEKQKT